MNELPQGWALACIPELISEDNLFVDGDWVESKDQDPNGDVRLIQLADVGDGRYVNKSNRFMTMSSALRLGCTFLKEGDLLVARMPDPLGRACVFPGDKKPSVTVVDVCIIRGKRDRFNQKWLMYFINTEEFRWQMNQLQSGSTRMRISRGNLATLPLPVPPFKEQTRIVEKLEELLSDLDAGVAELKTAKKKLEQYRQSLLKSAVEGALTAEWRKHNKPNETGTQLLERILAERRNCWEAKQLAKFAKQGKAAPKDWQMKYPAPMQPNFGGLPERPTDWVCTSLSQLLNQLRSGTAETSSRVETLFPVLKSSAVRQGSINFSALNYLNADQIREENSLEVGDLLISRLSGSVEYVGCCAVVENMPNTPAQYPDRIFCGKLVLSEHFFAEYLVVCFRSSYARGRIEAAAKSTAGHKRISLSDLLPFPIPLPPEEEMQEISRVVNDALILSDQMDVEIERGLKKSSAQRKNILRAAFAGELVPQDPNDEPASVLLERIRVQRAVRDAEKKPQSRRKKESA